MAVAEVEAVARAFHEGVANQDAAALTALYEEDAKFLPPNMPPCEGHGAIQAAMQQLLDMGATELDVEPLETTEADDMTIEYGRYTLRIEPPGGIGVTDVGKYVVVHRAQDDGSTKIVLDIFNSNSPLAA